MAQTGVPKAWFKHFYIFAVVWTIFWFFIWFKYSDPVISETVNLIQIALLALSNYVLYQSTEPSFWNPHIMVRLLLKESKFVPTTGVLILIHLIQRLYESIFIQKSVSKMSVVHYIVGYAFYFLLPLQYISSEPETNLESTTTTYALLIGAILAMIGQHLSIRKMASLRNDGSVGHKLPRGGIFNLVCSPHYTFEILFYFFIWLLTGSRMIFPFIFTLCNQSVSAIWTLKFYRLKFPDEMEDRRALIPFVL